MSANNIKLLTNEQLNALNEKFDFDVDGDYVVVINRYYNRKTPHIITKNFEINSKIRKVTISTEAMNEWIKLKEEKITKYSLFDVQHAINKLKLCYQVVDSKSIRKTLKNGISKIKSK